MIDFCTISDVERLYGVPAHVLRRWEEVIPLLSVQKDASGRRYYTKQNLRVVSRMKHLVYNLGLNTQESIDRLIEDTRVSGKKVHVLDELNDIRSVLEDLWLSLKLYGIR